MKIKILIVDDDTSIATTLSAVLELEGYETAIAFSGEEAIERAVAIKPDLLLADISMPGIDGVKAATEIVQVLPNCKVLFISGIANTAEDLLTSARERGLTFDIARKPIPPTDLLKMICEILSPRTRNPISLRRKYSLI